VSAARSRAAAALAVAVALLAATLPASAGASDGINLTGLHVIGGDVWHADNQFHLEWDPNPATSFPSEVRYELLGGGSILRNAISRETFDFPHGGELYERWLRPPR